jgi:predicted ester cyclase
VSEQEQEARVTDSMQEFAKGYTAAWNSGDPEQVAARYAEGGSLQVNQSAPAVGRSAITEVARGFMTGFPDMELLFDGLERVGDRVHFRWTFLGTNTGPGGTGRRVRFSGYEAWLIGPDGLIADSLGHFDEAEYARQLAAGVGDAEGL